MIGERILLVDDDPDILRILNDGLEIDGFWVVTAGTAKEAFERFEEYGPDLIVLDLALPDVDGLQVCRAIRGKSDVPIIMLTARDRLPDKVLGLNSGADDYLVKPFDYLELVARIRACLRRRSKTAPLSDILELGELRIDTNRRVVSKRGEKLCLTRREFNLLLLLARNEGRALKRSEIRRAIWPEGDPYKESRAIDVHIQHLRAKLEDNPSDPRYVRTVQGVGYMLLLDDEDRRGDPRRGVARGRDGAS